MSARLDEIRARWQYLADVPIKGNLDYARLGEQAFADMAALFELIERLSTVCDRCTLTFDLCCCGTGDVTVIRPEELGNEAPWGAPKAYEDWP